MSTANSYKDLLSTKQKFASFSGQFPCPVFDWFPLCICTLQVIKPGGGKGLGTRSSKDCQNQKDADPLTAHSKLNLMMAVNKKTIHNRGEASSPPQKMRDSG